MSEYIISESYDRHEKETQLLQLLRKTLADFMSGSSSLPISEAESILESILFVISYSPLTQASLEEKFKTGKQTIQKQLLTTKLLYQQVLLAMMPLNVDAYWQTVQSIGDFFHQYDINYQAHEVPATIDYFLAQPIDDQKIKGVTYINNYLNHLLQENKFCLPYKEQLAQLFSAYEKQLNVNYCHDVNNLFLVVFKQVLAKLIIKSRTETLILTKEERIQLEARLANSRSIESLFSKALKLIVEKNSLEGEDYYQECLSSLIVDIQHARKYGSLATYFITESAKEKILIFESNIGISDSHFTHLVGELPHIELGYLATYLKTNFMSVYDYLDLFDLGILSEQEISRIIGEFETEALVILLKYAGKECDEIDESCGKVLASLVDSEKRWHQLLGNMILAGSEARKKELQHQFSLITLAVDDFS